MTRLPTLGPRGEGWVALQAVALGGALLAGIVALANPGWHGTIRIMTTAGGLAVAALGAELSRRAARDLGRNLTPLPHPTGDANLIETGIYRRVRHPIYGGVILMTVGWGLLATSAPAIAIGVALVPFFWLKSTVEERWLEARFPGYSAYRRRTSRFIAWPD